jgi:K+-transporting ATPase ATPase B chain
VSGANWLQLLALVGALLATAPLLGAYLARVLGGGAAPGDCLFLPLERAIYRSAGVDPGREQPWNVYALALLAFSAVSLAGLYLLQRAQGVLPLDPTGVDGVPAALAFNTAASFVTNTNWQSYAGESTMSHLTQMTGLAVQNFVSAAAGIAVAVALVRGLTRRRAAWLIAAWLWFTVLFANFAEAIAEGRGKAQAEELRRTRAETIAHRRLADGSLENLPSGKLRVGDEVVVSAGEVIPADGEVIEGIASVDESAITGESAPVIRESGGDRSAVTGGTRVLSDEIVILVTAQPGESFLDRMIALVEGAERQRTPNEIALDILLAGLTIVFLLTVVSLQPFAVYSGAEQEVIVLVALLVTLIPTTIGGLLSAIGIAGMDRLVRRNVLALSGRAVEAAGDCSTLLLDKTGTITLGNRQAAELLPLPGVEEAELADAAQLASLADETPEGRSIVVLAKERYGLRERHLAEGTLVRFSAETRMSGVDLDGRTIRKGAADAVRRWVEGRGGSVTPALEAIVKRVAAAGGTPLVVATDATPLGVIHLKDVVKEGLRERFQRLRAMGIRTVMITGDNPLTARAIAAEAGVDDVLAEATPEDKLALIRREQAGGNLVAMTGDGTNDAPALAAADVGVAMNTGTQAAREAGNMVDLDSNPTKLIEIVEIGKQLLITRGSLTTFSIANDVAKYFAIIHAMFAGAVPELGRLDVMRLVSPESAILSAVVFNALIIVVLIPLALRGVRFRPAPAAAVLRRNLLVYGLGGLVAPFAGIKLIDLVVGGLGVV